MKKIDYSPSRIKDKEEDLLTRAYRWYIIENWKYLCISCIKLRSFMRLETKRRKQSFYLKISRDNRKYWNIAIDSLPIYRHDDRLLAHSLSFSHLPTSLPPFLSTLHRNVILFTRHVISITKLRYTLFTLLLCITTTTYPLLECIVARSSSYLHSIRVCIAYACKCNNNSGPDSYRK